METRYTIYNVDGTTEDRTVDWPKEPGYEAVRKITDPVLNGAWLEHVTVFVRDTHPHIKGFSDGYADMFVDEEGKLKGLPVNRLATAIYRENWLVHNPGSRAEDLDTINGPALLFHRKVWY